VYTVCLSVCLPDTIHVVGALLSPMRKFSSQFLVRERSALADPYCHSAWMSVGLCVRNFEVKYLGNQRS